MVTEPMKDETPKQRRERFLLEFENPFKCEKCNQRFKKKKDLREHKNEVHSYDSYDLDLT
ncbi:MAG TPA: hypothetical protein VH500_12690 [Nitrososphaeraceae archaeon]|jgi:uncharacterized Zn-finger protein